MALGGYQALYQFNSVTQFMSAAWAPPRTEDNDGARDGTCDAEFGFGRGFGICLFDQTNNTLTSGIELIGNNLWAIQKAFGSGGCYCNTECSPSQIVCTDTKIVKVVLEILEGLGVGDLIGKNPLGNVASQLIYQLTNYQVHCYCPSRETCEEACPAVQQPEKCYLNPNHPNSKKLKASNATAAVAA